jgi:hypothetical protein
VTTTSAAQADALYNEVLDGGEVWTLKDVGGYPTPRGTDEVANAVGLPLGVDAE